MPTYEYHCRSCGERFSRTEKISEHDPASTTCPKCHSRETERVMSGFNAHTPRKS
jgi:putative FmdB family regulatory protein